MEDQAGQALVDLICTQTLVGTGMIGDKEKWETLRIRCIHGDERWWSVYASREKRGHWRWRVGLDMPYDVVVGRAWPSFEALIKGEVVGTVGESQGVLDKRKAREGAVGSQLTNSGMEASTTKYKKDPWLEPPTADM